MRNSQAAVIAHIAKQIAPRSNEDANTVFVCIKSFLKPQATKPHIIIQHQSAWDWLVMAESEKVWFRWNPDQLADWFVHVLTNNKHTKKKVKSIDFFQLKQNLNQIFYKIEKLLFLNEVEDFKALGIQDQTSIAVLMEAIQEMTTKYPNPKYNGLKYRIRGGPHVGSYRDGARFTPF